MHLVVRIRQVRLFCWIYGFSRAQCVYLGNHFCSDGRYGGLTMLKDVTHEHSLIWGDIAS